MDKKLITTRELLSRLSPGLVKRASGNKALGSGAAERIRYFHPMDGENIVGALSEIQGLPAKAMPPGKQLCLILTPPSPENTRQTGSRGPGVNLWEVDSRVRAEQDTNARRIDISLTDWRTTLSAWALRDVAKQIGELDAALAILAHMTLYGHSLAEVQRIIKGVEKLSEGEVKGQEYVFEEEDDDGDFNPDGFFL